MKKILMFHMDLDGASDQKSMRSDRLREAVEISRSDYCQELGYLAGIIGFEKKKEIYMGPNLPGRCWCCPGWTTEESTRFWRPGRNRGCSRFP